MRTTLHFVCAATVAVLISASPAGAATPGPGAPSIDQYIEAIPTSAGPQSVVSGEERLQPLTREAGQQVNAEAGSDAEALTKIATSSRYGAPVETQADARTVPPSFKPGAPVETEVDHKGAPQSSEPAQTSQDDVSMALERPTQTAQGSESRLVTLIAFMAASLVAAAAYAGIPRRSRESNRSAP